MFGMISLSLLVGGWRNCCSLSDPAVEKDVNSSAPSSKMMWLTGNWIKSIRGRVLRVGRRRCFCRRAGPLCCFDAATRRSPWPSKWNSSTNRRYFRRPVPASGTNIAKWTDETHRSGDKSGWTVKLSYTWRLGRRLAGEVAVEEEAAAALEEL